VPRRKNHQGDAHNLLPQALKQPRHLMETANKHCWQHCKYWHIIPSMCRSDPDTITPGHNWVANIVLQSLSPAVTSSCRPAYVSPHLLDSQHQLKPTKKHQLNTPSLCKHDLDSICCQPHLWQDACMLVCPQYSCSTQQHRWVVWLGSQRCRWA
jgi:hypothetical protein